LEPVIGGLAVARALASQGGDVMILEAAHTVSTGTSSRNSEVHAGIYLTGSLKAQLCVAGNRMVYACAERGVTIVAAAS
jgi:L-2-hydroxyglutarate oxidase LhgO